MTTVTEDAFQVDVLIVGAGPAGLSCAIRLKQLNPKLRICVLEKGANVGAHILSGAILDPKALYELLPDWEQRNPPPMIPAKQDQFLYLSPHKSYSLPLPKTLKNQGNYIIRLSIFCQWLAAIAESMGIEIYTGFAGSSLIFNESTNTLIGVQTDMKGLDKQGNKTARYQEGMKLYANQIFLAEGCRGSLTQKIIKHFSLNKNADPQTYGLGVKELWQIDPSKHQLGKIIHTIGYPLNTQTYGGGFLYHIDQHQIALGFVVGLDFQPPHLDPFQELQKFKTHPDIKQVLINAKRIGYGAKSLVEGGIQSLPKLHFPGGLIMGDAAGFLNVSKLKGIHTAMKSGILAAAAYHDNKTGEYMESYIQPSWLFQELHSTRNIRPYFRFGLIPGLILSAIDTYIFRGKTPWTLHHIKPDFAYCAKNNTTSTSFSYSKPDNHLTFDKPTSLVLSNIHHDDNQPCHLKLINPELSANENKSYAYCPAGVYEIHEKKLYIHAQNCLHCKACDIKDKDQNIIWTCPEGGSGPNFFGM
jgi:electron-transferring-flavoprotein dehydrogenase